MTFLCERCCSKGKPPSNKNTLHTSAGFWLNNRSYFHHYDENFKLCAMEKETKSKETCLCLYLYFAAAFFFSSLRCNQRFPEFPVLGHFLRFTPALPNTLDLFFNRPSPGLSRPASPPFPPRLVSIFELYLLCSLGLFG